MRLLKHSLFLLALQFCSLIASFAISIVVSRTLGASGKGNYSLIVLVGSMLTLITGLGLNMAATYFVSRADDSLEDVVGLLIAVSGLLGLAASTCAGLAYIFLRTTYFREVVPAQILILCFELPLAQLSTSLGAIISGRNRTDLVAGINFAMLAITISIQVGLMGLGRLTVTTALAAWLIGALGSTLLTFLAIHRFCPIHVSFHKAFLLKKMLGYGSKAYIANLTTFFNYRLDTLLINGFLNSASVGYYSIAVSLSEAIWLLANSVSTVLFPYISSIEKDNANRLAPAICRITIFMTVLGSLILLILGRPLIVLTFSIQMLPALQPLLLLLPGIISLSGGKIIASYLSGIGKPIYATYISSVNLILILILDLVMIPAWGINGAAIASSIVYTIVTALGIIFFMKESGASFWATIIIRSEDFTYFKTVIKRFWSRLKDLEQPAR